MTKPIKVTYAPGCFSNFEGTQEELDAFMAEIEKTFSTMTPEELEANSISLDEESFEQLMEDDPEYAEAIKNLLSNDPPQTLQ